MTLSLFRKPEPAMTPRRAALRDWRQSTDALINERHRMAEKIGVTRETIDAATAAKSAAKAAHDAVDRAQADALYSGNPAPDLAELNRAAAIADKVAEMKADRARAAEIVYARLLVDHAAITTRIDAADDAKWELLHHVLVEDALVELAPEFRAKEEAFLPVHRRAFVVALAADKIALKRNIGIF